jgi:hypothetical protein
MRIKEMSVISFSVLALAACGGSGGGGEGGGGEGVGISMSASTGSGNGAPDSPYGHILLEQGDVVGEPDLPWISTFSALFVEHYEQVMANCHVSTVGECTFSLCYTDNEDKLHVSAGDLTVEGVKPFSDGVIQPNQELLYAAVADDGGLLAGGSTITVKASGGQVPAFSISTTAPDPIVVPYLEMHHGAFQLNPAYDFPLAWTNGKDGTVEVELTASEHPGNLVCVFPAAAGNGVVPAGTLQKMFTKTGAAFGGSMNIRAITRTKVAAGKFAIDMSVAHRLSADFSLD